MQAKQLTPLGISLYLDPTVFRQRTKGTNESRWKLSSTPRTRLKGSCLLESARWKCITVTLNNLDKEHSKPPSRRLFIVRSNLEAAHKR